jgi:transaldolase
MKIFMDTADVDEIREAAAMGMVDGVTTNPSLIAKTGKPFDKVIEEICGIVDGPVSAEAVKPDAEGMVAEARQLSKIHKNVVVKIPMTAEGLKAVKKCASEGIRTNVTLVFQSIQGLLAAKAGASFVSPFIGRLDDICQEGMDMVAELMTMLQNYNYKTEVIVASIRHPVHVVQSAMIGAHIVTLPFKVFDRLVNHPLTDIGIEKFLADYKKIPKS